MDPKDLEKALFWRSERAAAQLFTGEHWASMTPEKKERIRKELTDLIDREAFTR